jgi:hypothetical protein
MDYVSDATLNRDRSRDLLIIGQFEALKHEVRLAIINTTNILTSLCLSKYRSR